MTGGWILALGVAMFLDDNPITGLVLITFGLVTW